MCRAVVSAAVDKPLLPPATMKLRSINFGSALPVETAAVAPSAAR
jgi:hypothetical protein